MRTTHYTDYITYNDIDADTMERFIRDEWQWDDRMIELAYGYSDDRREALERALYVLVGVNHFDEVESFSDWVIMDFCLED